MSCARGVAKELGGKIVAEYPFITSVGVDLPNYACNSTAEYYISVAGRTAIADTNGAFSLKAPDLSRLHRAGITGKGVGIAVIDTGIFPHLDFCVPRMRIAAFADFVNGKTEPYDDNGHGTAVAGIACGGGYFSSATGAAPMANIVALKAVDESGSGNVLGILSAMQWLYSNYKTLGVRVVNVSLGSEPLGARDPLVLGTRALTAAGLVVVASAGNSGPTGGTLKSPGVAEQAITVGGAEKGERGWYAAEFSSRGTKSQNKPDLIAPAVEIATTSANGGFMVMSGTSAAAPLVSGFCALTIQRHPTYTPPRIKERVLSVLHELDCPREVCGNGLFYPFGDL